MQEQPLQRFQTFKVLYTFALIDTIVPAIFLLILQFLCSDSGWSNTYSCIAIGSGVLFASITAIQGGYSRYSQRSISKKLEITFKTWVFNVFVLLVLSFFLLDTFQFDRLVMTIWVTLTPILVLALKFRVNALSYKLSKSKIQVSVLGRHYEFNEFETLRLEQANLELSYLSMVELDGLKKKVKALQPSFLVINLDLPASNQLIKELTKLELEGVQLLSLPNFMETFLRKCFIPYESMDLAYLSRIRAFKRKDLFLKRSIDFICALSLVLITAPVMLWAALKIRKESPGPIIFSQDRVARGGNEKTIYKFRSMHVDAEKHGAQFASKDDPRAYEFGGFMRKTRIDELPQLWNVIRGDLHFVGPRPERKVFTDTLEEEIPYYNERHLISPGITGWAQVLYPYGANTEDARQKLMYDLYYIKHWSIWLELETLIRTVGVILGKKGW